MISTIGLFLAPTTQPYRPSTPANACPSRRLAQNEGHSKQPPKSFGAVFDGIRFALEVVAEGVGLMLLLAGSWGLLGCLRWALAAIQGS